MTRSLAVFFTLIPSVALAAPAITNFKSLIGVLVGLLNVVIPIIIALALLAFFWGVFLFVRNSDGGDEKGEGRRIMIWGIIALFVMVSFFGIVRIVQNTFFGGSAGGGSYGGGSFRGTYDPSGGLNFRDPGSRYFPTE